VISSSPFGALLGMEVQNQKAGLQHYLAGPVSIKQIAEIEEQDGSRSLDIDSFGA